MLLMFDMFDDYPPMPEDDVAVSRKFIRLLIDFGKQDRAPVDGWKPLDLEDPTYLLVDKEFEVKEGMPMQDRMKFWNSLPNVYWHYKPAHKNVNARDEL